MKKIVFMAIVILMFIAGVIFFKNSSIEKSDSLSDVKQAEPIIAGASEDKKALGFSGQKKIAVDSKGNIFIAYRKKIDGIYEIFVSKASSNKNKLELVKNKEISVSSGSTIHQRNPSIVADKNDQLHIVWYGAESEDRVNERQIKYANSSDGGESWSGEINISNVLGYSGENLWQEHPDIISSKSGKLFTVWEGKDDKFDKQQIKLSESTNHGKSWSKWINIQPTPGSAQSRPTILENSRGKLSLFMYSSLNSSIHQIWESSSINDGKSWSKWKNISKSLTDSRHMSGVVDSNNNAYVVWRQPSGDKLLTQIFYSVLSSDKWSNPLPVSPSSAFQFFPTIGKDASDNIYISWVETTNSSGFPNEDPENTKSYLALYDRNAKSFLVSKIADSSISYFPVVSTNSKIGDSILVAFLKNNQLYLVAKNSANFK